jgi:hypothetical protein
MFKKLSIVCLFFFSILNAYSQKKYCVAGTVCDSVSLKYVPNGLVEIYSSAKNAVIGFKLTDSLGQFKVYSSSQPSILKISIPGYQTQTINLSFPDSVTLLNLNTVYLLPQVELLKGGGVVMKKTLVEKIEVDKKIYSLENDVLTNGGTALDALRQIPAISVDGDGSISLRGSENVLIYINGKQSSLSGEDRKTLLMQIPAANIESIEVNTNPGAKQDAEGVSGIINITLKQNKTKGQNGFITLGVGTNNKYNATAAYNYSNGKWSSSNTLTYRYNDVWGRGYNERDNFTKDTFFVINQYNESQNLSRNATFSGSVDYKPSKKWLYSFNYLASLNTDNDDEINDIILSDNNREVKVLQEIGNVVTKKSLNYDAGVLVKKTFEKTAHNIVGIVNYSLTDRTNNIDIVRSFKDPLTNQNLNQNKGLSYNTFDNGFANFLAQIDYVKPFNDYRKFEVGAKYTARSFDNQFNFDSFNYKTQTIEIDNGRTNRFVYNENVSAAYLTLSDKVNDLIKYNIGLRVENTLVNGEEKLTNTPVSFNYTNLFPSCNLSLTLQKKYNIPDIQLGYSRRINRPTQGQINPFINVNDPFNIFTGNPTLKPELTDALELSAFYNTSKVIFTTNLYFRQTNSVIWRYRTVDSIGISRVSFYNLDYNRSMGAEVIARFTVMKKIKTTLNGNLYRQTLSGNVLGSQFSNDAWVFTGKAIMSYTFWNKTDLQLSYNYMGPRALPQGKMLSMYGLDLGFKKDIYKEKIALSISFNDVFDNRRFKIVMYDANFSSSVYRKRETRIFTINLTWKFGESNNVPEKKPKMPEKEQEMNF